MRIKFISLQVMIFFQYWIQIFEIKQKQKEYYYNNKYYNLMFSGPVVFVSKMLGMLPAIWTEEESESECKSYFNLYTFVIFAGIKQ